MSQTNGWFKRNRKNLEPLIGLIVVLIISFAIIPLSPILINTEGLKAFIESEATILGFFGIVVVYMLTSLDTRIDRLEQQRFELDRKQMEKEATDTKNLRDRVRELKKSFIKRSLVIGCSLVTSITICVGLLAIVDIVKEQLETTPSSIGVQSTAFFGGLALLLFLESMYFLFELFYDVAKAS